MTDFTIHTVETAPVEARPILAAVESKFGFVPNLLAELAAAPTVLKAYTNLSDLLARTSFSPVEQQLILATVSVANQCTYCVAAHSAALLRAGLAPDQIYAIREDRPLVDAKLEALRRFATMVVVSRGHVPPDGIQAFLSAGYRREQILEVLLGVALKTLSNYANHLAHTPLDEPFEAFAWDAVTTE